MISTIPAASGKRQSVPGNQAAKQDAMQRAIAVVEGIRE
jgi:hypothetical protein